MYDVYIVKHNDDYSVEVRLKEDDIFSTFEDAEDFAFGLEEHYDVNSFYVIE